MIAKNVRHLAPFALCAGLAFIAGCPDRPSTVPVQGQLTWEDGKAVPGATVRFVPAKGGQEALGGTDKDGVFKLSTGPYDGAVPGDYKVVVTKAAQVTTENKGGTEPKTPEEMQEAMKKMMTKTGTALPKVVDPVPAEYGKEETTPLTATVAANQKIELKLKRK